MYFYFISLTGRFLTIMYGFSVMEKYNVKNDDLTIKK